MKVSQVLIFIPWKGGGGRKREEEERERERERERIIILTESLERSNYIQTNTRHDNHKT